MQTPRRIRALVLSLTAAVALGAGVVPATAASPAGTEPSISAWLVARDPTIQFGTPAAGDSGNSSGGTVIWQRIETGLYGVDIGGITDFSGVPQVTAMSTSPRSCVVQSWGGTALQVIIRCLDPQGVSRDTPFVLTYLRGTGASGGASGRLAHAWVDADFVKVFYNHVSEGGLISRVTNGTGDYTLTIPGLGKPAGSGTILVTPYFKVDQGETPSACTTASWVRSGSSLKVDVRCRTLAGAAVDSKFDLQFLRQLGPEGFGGGPAAYLRASQKSRTTAYTPTATFAWQSNGKTSSILRTGVGTYRVTLKGMPGRGAAIVTAYGPGKARCQLSSIGTTTPVKIVVRCFKPNGALVDSDFTLAWTK
jgi:hypothetical protein